MRWVNHKQLFNESEAQRLTSWSTTCRPSQCRVECTVYLFLCFLLFRFGIITVLCICVSSVFNLSVFVLAWWQQMWNKPFCSIATSYHTHRQSWYVLQHVRTITSIILLPTSTAHNRSLGYVWFRGVDDQYTNFSISRYSTCWILKKEKGSLLCLMLSDRKWSFSGKKNF